MIESESNKSLESSREFFESVQYLVSKLHFIILGGVLFVAMLFVASKIMHKNYEISTFINPGYAIDAGEKVYFLSPEIVQGMVINGVFDQAMAGRLNVQKGDLPQMNAMVLKNSDLIKIWTVGRDADYAMRVLDEEVNQIKSQIERGAGLWQHKVDVEIEKNAISIANAQKRYQMLEKHIETTSLEIDMIKKYRMQMLRQGKTNPLALILISKEIVDKEDQNNNLQQSLLDLDKERQDLELQSKVLLQKRDSIKLTERIWPETKPTVLAPFKARVVGLGGFILGSVISAIILLSRRYFLLHKL